jgi:hypothetical protein
VSREHPGFAECRLHCRSLIPAASLYRSEKGVEKQFRWKCSGCDLTLGYQSSPFGSCAKFIFVLPSAVTTQEEEEERQTSTAASAQKALALMSKGGLDEGLVPGIDAMTGTLLRRRAPCDVCVCPFGTHNADAPVQ